MNDQAETSAREEVVHQCPPDYAPVMPCCGRTPFEVPPWHRMAVDPEYVTCGSVVVS